MAKELQVKCW